MTAEQLKAYKDAWKKLQDEVLDEKTGWGKEDLKKRMDKLLIECMEAYLG
jgi:preprotein translocase subunit SecA